MNSMRKYRELIEGVIEESESEKAKFLSWFAGSKIVDGSGNPLKVFHGTNAKFDKFDTGYGADKTFWFSSDYDKIKNGESGAVGSTIIKECYLRITNPAGWDEYDSLMLDQIEAEGFDGIILDDDFVVFDPEQIWIVK